MDIVVTKKKLIEKIIPIGFVFLDQFHARMLRPGKSLALYSHELKKLLGQVMAELTDDTVRRQLILHQFLSGIPEAISKQIRASGDVEDLPSIVERSRLLMKVNVGKLQGRSRSCHRH